MNGEPRRMVRPRLIDVANAVGVSTAVVSYVLSNRSQGTIRVGEATRQRVLDAVRELGYVPNPVARSLARGRNGLIGVFTYEPIFPMDQGNFFHPFLVGIEAEAEAQGQDLLLFTKGSSEGVRNVYVDGVNRLQLADGAVLLGREGDKQEVLGLLDDGYPFVYIGRRSIPGRPLPYVTADYTKGAQDLLSHLWELGHRSVIYVGDSAECDATGRPCREPIEDRERGIHTFAAEHTLEYKVTRCTAADITSDWVSDKVLAGSTGFVIENDALAHAFARAAHEADLAAPDAVSFVVLGDPHDPSTACADWTRFSIPMREMGRESVRMLMRLLKNEKKGFRATELQVALPCQVIVGTSTGPAIDVASWAHARLP